jgi:signal transduction histidine kinase
MNDARNIPEPTQDRSGFFEKLDVAFLVHELKDPISVIETGVRMMLERTDKYGPISERQQRALQRVLRNTLKARRMLHDLLEVGRSEAGYCICCRFHPAEALHDALMDALETVSVSVPDRVRNFADADASREFLLKNGIVLQLTPSVHGLLMLQDETKFQQIVGNLIKNALHHRKTTVEITMAREANDLHVSIADDGPGIEPKHHRIIFERYTQVEACSGMERTGHGLGLAGARALARCLGGDIDISSKKGSGATFHVHLPMALKQNPLE